LEYINTNTIERGLSIGQSDKTMGHTLQIIEVEQQKVWPLAKEGEPPIL